MSPFIADVLAAYLTHAEVSGRKSLKQMKVRANHICWMFGLTPARELTTDLLNEYRKRRHTAGVTHVTVNREIEVLRAAFRLADLPFPKFARAPEHNVRQGFFEEDEWIEVMSYLPAHLAAFGEFAYITGWRKSEIAGLRWENITPDGIVLTDSKNGRGRIIPIAGKLRSLLGGLAEARDSVAQMGHWTSPWVFHDSGGNKVRDFRKAWATACRRAGVTGRLFHDLRRTAVRNMILKGIDREVAKKITGHTTDSMFTRYQIVDQRQMTAALEKLED